MNFKNKKKCVAAPLRCLGPCFSVPCIRDFDSWKWCCRQDFWRSEKGRWVRAFPGPHPPQPWKWVPLFYIEKKWLGPISCTLFIFSFLQAQYNQLPLFPCQFAPELCWMRNGSWRPLTALLARCQRSSMFHLDATDQTPSTVIFQKSQLTFMFFIHFTSRSELVLESTVNMFSLFLWLFFSVRTTSPGILSCSACPIS